MENPSESQKIPFVGLRPYKTEENKIFFGRERQVYDLLTLLQSNRIIAILGPSGCGKSSLINAGLIPEILAGQNGLAGKDWAYTIFRPGSNPLANFASAISKNNLLNPSVQVPADEVLRLENNLRYSNKSFINYFKDSEIVQNKNFLIVVDQFEDIFKYPPEKEEDITLFVDNLLRIDHEPNLGIYVIFCLRNEYLGNLFPYRRLQEYLNEFQYSIPRLRRADIEEILHKSSNISEFSFAKNAIDYLHKGLGNDPGKTAHLQSLLYHSIKNNPKASLSEISFENIGGFSNCFAQNLNSKYEQQPAEVQLTIEKLIKTITNIDDLGTAKKPKKFKELVNLCECDASQLIAAISFFNTTEHQFLNQIPPVITDNSPAKIPALINEDLIDICYPEFFKSWDLFHEWIEKERESKEMYLRLVNDAQRYESGASGFLKPPELNIFQKWFENQKPSKIWANQYHPNYQVAIDYLNKSILAFEEEVKAKELAQKNKLAAIEKRWGIIAAVSLLVIIVVLGFAYNAHLAKNEAERQTEKASLAHLATLKQMKIAQEAKDKAEEEQAIAIKARELADFEKEKALKAQQEEEKAKINLAKSLEQEKVAKSTALKKQQEAERANRIAEAAKIEEEQAKKLAQTRENLANIQNELYVLENELRVTSANEALIEKIISTFDLYKTFCMALFGELKPSNQLQKLLFELDQDIQYYHNFPPIRSISNAGLRALVRYENTIATGGDDGFIYLVKNDFIDQINLQKRIRALNFLKNSTSFLVGTFDGSIFLVDAETKSIQLVNQPYQTGKPIKSIISGNDAQYISMADKSLWFFSESGEMTNKLDFEEKLTCGLWLSTVEKFLIASNKEIYLVAENESKPIANNLIQFDSPVSAMAIHSNLIALGFKNGKIKVLDFASFLNGSGPQQLIQEFIDHQTEITQLKFSSSGILYSSGLDKKIHAYKLDPSTDNTSNQLVKFEAGKNWIWDMTVSDNDEVVAVDESGALYFWVNNPTIQIQRLNTYLNQDQNSRRIN